MVVVVVLGVVGGTVSAGGRVALRAAAAAAARSLPSDWCWWCVSIGCCGELAAEEPASDRPPPRLFGRCFTFAHFGICRSAAESLNFRLQYGQGTITIIEGACCEGEA